MSTFRSVEEIDVWQSSRTLIREIYSLSKKPPFCRDFALQNQIRKAAVSIAPNIAEGFERSGNREFINFLSIAKGSTGEVRTQLYVALDMEYITKNEFDTAIAMLTDISRGVGGLMRYLGESRMKGHKYNHLQKNANPPSCMPD